MMAASTVDRSSCSSAKENQACNRGSSSISSLTDEEESLWPVFHKLKAVLETRPEKKAAGGSGCQVTYDDSKRIVDMTEILPNLFIGDEGAAKNAFYLKKIKVTHVLNAAQGSGHGFVDTDENFYKSFGIKYKGLKLADTVQTNISMYFTKVADYIDLALEQDGGKILVNCMMGMSRSSTCVLSYMMIKLNMTSVEALMALRRHRECRPNDGFLRQLADLDNKLRKERKSSQSPRSRPVVTWKT